MFMKNMLDEEVPSEAENVTKPLPAPIMEISSVLSCISLSKYVPASIYITSPGTTTVNA